MKNLSTEMTGRIAWLRRLPYFAALNEPALKTIAASTLVRTYRTDEVVMVEGEPCAGLFIVQYCIRQLYI